MAVSTLPDIVFLSLCHRSLSQEWNEIVLNGWEGRKHFDKKLNCCFHYQSGETSQVVLANKNPWLQCKRVLYTATQFTCQNPGKRNGSYPDGVYLTTSNSSCNSRSRHPITIHYPQKQANASIALCTKIAYGSISSRLLTEWYEIQKQLGVNKVVTFLYNLTDSGLVVLKHYQEQGFVDLLSYQFPHTGTLLKNEPPHDKTNKMTCAPSEDRSAWASVQSDQYSLSA